MDALSISRIAHRGSLVGALAPRAIRPGGLIDDGGQEATVRHVDVYPDWPLAPELWVIESVTSTGAELVTKHAWDDRVTVLRRAGGAL